MILHNELMLKLHRLLSTNNFSIKFREFLEKDRENLINKIRLLGLYVDETDKDYIDKNYMIIKTAVKDGIDEYTIFFREYREEDVGKNIVYLPEDSSQLFKPDRLYLNINGLNGSLCDIDFSNFNSDYVVNANEAFACCNGLRTIDFKHLDFKNVEDIGNMFEGCYRLEKINMDRFKGENVINTAYMFSQCVRLKDTGLKNFKGTKLENISHMFYECNSLETLDLRNLEISERQIKDKYYWVECGFDFDVSELDTGLLNGCDKLKQIIIDSSKCSYDFNCYITDIDLPDCKIIDIKN